MIHRKFDTLKFRRTYIGGSKQSESKAFEVVQGTKEDNSDCNWIEYRRLLTQYMDDRLNVLLSWKYLTNIVSIIFATIALFVLVGNYHIAFILVGISAAFYSISKYLNHKEKQILSGYDFSLDIVLQEINNQTGLILSKN